MPTVGAACEFLKIYAKTGKKRERIEAPTPSDGPQTSLEVLEAKLPVLPGLMINSPKRLTSY